MAKFRKNEPNAAFRQIGVTVYLSDGTNYPPDSTVITPSSDLIIRQGSTAWQAASGTMTNYPINAGSWLYVATQAELNFDGTEFELRLNKAGFYMPPWIVDMERSVWDEVPGTPNALVAGSYGEMTARPNGAVVTDGSNSSSQFITNLTDATTGVWIDAWLGFLTGANAGQVHKITAYNGGTKQVTVQNPYTFTPAGGDRFILINK